MVAMAKDKISELSDNIAIARKRELAFGICIGSSPETTVLVCHRTKDPETLSRQAKKEGESAKIAYGMMAIKSKDLMLSCQAEVPAGLARKVKEMLKAAGQKFKVVILDAAGNLLESDGDSEEGESPEGAPVAVVAEPSPEQARWVEASERIRPHVDEALELGGPLANKIRAVWSFALDKAEGAEPDYAAAVKSVGMLTKLIGEATKAAGGAGAKAAGDSAPAGAAGGGAAGDPAPAGAPAGAAGAAPPAGDAAPAPGPAPAGAAGDAAPAGAAGDAAKPQKPDLKGTDAEKLTRAGTETDALDKLVAAYLALIPGSPEPVPPKWATEVTRIKGILTPLKAPGALLDAKVLDKLLKDITALANTVREKSAQKAAWKKARDLIGIRILTIDNHAQSPSAEISPKVAAIKAKLAAADAMALAQKFDEAMKAIAPLGAECDKLEVSADACANYKAVLAHRQGLVAASVALHPTGVADIDTLHTKVVDLLAKAQADAAAGKFADAVKKLDEIPPIDTRKEVLRNSQANYAARTGRIDVVIANCEALPAADKALIQTELTAFKKTYDNAKYAKTRDYARSEALLMLIEMKEVPYFNGQQQAYTNYRTAYTAFKPKLDLFKAHPGREGIEPFYLAMEADLLSAEAEVKANKPGTAAAILNRSSGDWAKEEARANDCKTYKDKLAALKPLLDAQRGKPAAASALAQADALVATAATKAAARDYAAAVANLTEAETRAADAKAAGDAQAAQGALKDGAALGNLAADFAAAYKVYTDMRADLAARDPTGTFAGSLVQADVTAALAQAEAAKAAPDWNVARGHLDGAVVALETLLLKVVLIAPWQRNLAAAKALINTTLPGVNTDACIQPQIDEAKRLMTEAEALAAAPGLDIAGAEAKLTAAMTIARQAQSDAALYPAVKTDIALIDAAKVLIATTGPLAPHLAPRVVKLDALKADALRLIAAKDMKGAGTKAREGAQMTAPINADIVKGTEVLRRKRVWYDVPVLAVTGPGREVCLPHTVPAAAKYAVFLTQLAVPNFDLAHESIGPPNIDLQMAKKMLDGNATYEPKRAAAELALNAARALRCPPIDAALTALEKRYTAAEAQAKAATHVKAEPEMDAIKPAAEELVRTALAYKVYDLKRIATRAKLDEALAHKEAAAIQPMLTRLQAKYDAAVKLADGGDVTGAGAMMPEILADAELAIESANNAATFGKVTGALDAAAGTGFLPAAVIAATQLVLDKLNARPEKDSAKTQLDTATTQMTAARAGGAGAKAALQAAIAACEAADEAMSQFRMLEQSVKRAQDLIAALKAHAQAVYVAGKLAPVETAVTGALAAAKTAGDYLAAATALEAQFTLLGELKALADGHATYVALRAEATVEPRLAVLEKHDHRYAIKPQIDTMRAKLAEAATKVAEFLVPEAIKLLQEARAIGQGAFVMAEMRANRPPSVADVKEMLARPGGQAEVDAMVQNLEPDAQGPVVAVVFEARFGCKLQLVDATGNPVPIGKNIMKYYDLMSQLPPGHASGNDSMLVFTEKGTGGSYYDSIGKDAVMNEGQDEFSREYGFGRDFEVGGQDDASKPTDMAPVSRFSWNTLHEVGHAVDDKQGYMKRNQGRADHGGWTEYGGAVGPVAQIFATEFKYDRGYIEKYMLHNRTPDLPPPPAGVTPEDWEIRRVAVVGHIELAFDSKKPWNSNAQASRLVIGGVVYQESYPGDWKSYKLDARKQGMTGYQFRAPGEFFSELYAAYHIGKMKPTHPAMAWVATL